MDPIPPALESLLNEIQRALDAELYYAAITVALSVPDVCSWLTNDPDLAKLHVNRKKQSKNYKTWFDANLGRRFSSLTADDCYSMRCGVMHQGSFGRPDDQYDRIIFLTPQKNPGMGTFRLMKDVVVTMAPGVSFGSISGKVLQMEAIWFCEQVIAAAREWAVANADAPNFLINLPNLVRFRPEGLPPYMVGVPLIA